MYKIFGCPGRLVWSNSDWATGLTLITGVELHPESSNVPVGIVIFQTGFPVVSIRPTEVVWFEKVTTWIGTIWVW